MAGSTFMGGLARARALVVVGLVALVAGPVAAAPAWAPAAGEDGAGRSALAEAGRQRQAAYKLADEAREQALVAAGRGYAALSQQEAHGPDVRAEAAYRGGELLRARGLTDEARALFEQGHRLGAIPQVGEEADEAQRDLTDQAREFAARCLLERGHLERRAERAEAAATLYGELASVFADRRRQAAHGRGWQLRMLLELGRVEQAEEALLGFAERFPEYPRDALRHAERVVEAQLEAGRRAQADSLVTRLAELLAPALAEESGDEQLLHGALDALRVTLSPGPG